MTDEEFELWKYNLELIKRPCLDIGYLEEIERTVERIMEIENITNIPCNDIEKKLVHVYLETIELKKEIIDLRKRVVKNEKK